MKYGVFHFSYSGFRGFERRMRDEGSYTVNLGDYMQTLAVRAMYARMGVPDEDVIPVDRDRMHLYDGPEVIVPFNGCLYDRHLPPAPAIRPAMIGVQARRSVIRRNRAWFAAQGPIGCRDRATADLLAREGIEAYVTGCLTMTAFAPRPAPAGDARPFIIRGDGAGALPDGALAAMPAALRDAAEQVVQRTPMQTLPLRPEDMARMEEMAAALLARYRAEASMVLTPLHHAATPCLSSGIPVVLCRAHADDRFSFLAEHLDVHVAPAFDGIDWAPTPPDLSALRALQDDSFRRAVGLAGDRPGWRPSGFARLRKILGV